MKRGDMARAAAAGRQCEDTAEGGGRGVARRDKMRARCYGTLLLAAATWCTLLHHHGAEGLRGARAWSPLAARRGADVELRCEYDLEADALYAVKWYRGDREFCRYSPRDHPPLKVFHLPGLDVDVSASDAERVRLRAVSRGAAGRYTCEVSADAPSFHTALVNTSLVVVDVPPAGPLLHGIKPRYRAGTLLHGECVCRDSLPSANLTFYINDVPAGLNYVRHRVERGEDELVTSVSTLRFIVHPRHFIGGKLKVRCTASIYTIYWRSMEKSAVEERALSDAEVSSSPAPPPGGSQRVAIVYPMQGHPAASESSGERRRVGALTSVLATLAGQLCAASLALEPR